MATQLTPFDVGQIAAHMHHGLGPLQISRLVKRADGTTFSDTAISNAMEKLQNNKKWRGEQEPRTGRPRKTTEALDRKIVATVKKLRGKRVVTCNYLRKVYPQLKQVSNSLIEERLHDAGLRHLRRRRKSVVAKHHLKPRLDYCRWVLKKQQRTLERFCYTDGTVFFLDRTEEENEQTQRAALGSRVWRQVDGSDGLWGDCVGPSAYSKSQGIPVKIWGMLANGLLFIEILDPGVNMDIPTYTELIEDKFEDWVGSCDMLVCDFEGCLRSKHSVEALEKIGLSLVPGYPKVSQDFNAIENVWNLLRKRLFATLPKGLESRDAFIVRLKAAVKWLNQHKQKEMWHYCTNQHERAYECIHETKGFRTSW